jgi:hypothetical protein
MRRPILPSTLTQCLEDAVLPRNPLIVWTTIFTLFSLTTDQSVSRRQRFSVLPRRRELRRDVRAHQLASNAAPIRWLGVLASDE